MELMLELAMYNNLNHPENHQSLDLHVKVLGFQLENEDHMQTVAAAAAVVVVVVVEKVEVEVESIVVVVQRNDVDKKLNVLLNQIHRPDEEEYYK